MCKRNGESVDHLFLHCPFASDLWSMEFLGLCRALFWGCYGVGKAALVIIEMVVFGPSFFIAYCGVFGGRGIVDVLKILRDLFRTSSLSFLEL